MSGLDALVEKLDFELRRAVRYRVDTMMREIRHMQERGDSNLVRILSDSWTIPRLEIVCGLNSFYQIILAPLALPTRLDRDDPLGGSMKIRYGEALIFDDERRRLAQKANADFLAMLSGLRIGRSVLRANHASDLVYTLSRLVDTDGTS